MIILAVLSHFSDEGHEFIIRVGESTWSKVCMPVFPRLPVLDIRTVDQPGRTFRRSRSSCPV